MYVDPVFSSFLSLSESRKSSGSLWECFFVLKQWWSVSGRRSRSGQFLSTLMDSVMANLYQNLSLTDEDWAVHELPAEAQRAGVAEVDHCLVGKVLSGKKVNRDAFKGLIEQLWSQFGKVEIESVGENIFMFYFTNMEDRNRIWQRGPWYFDKSLIALEKPTGMGDISCLGFNTVELWVQIHDVPIMCMNRRTAKWLAEQIGGVIDIPTEPKDCWGKFMRVKVQLTIPKPLKRWLRLKLDDSDTVVMVGLKYERLPDFCYACGKIGHVIKECLDVGARTEALSGQFTKYGSWMRALIPDRLTVRHPPHTSAPFPGKVRPPVNLCAVVQEGPLNSMSGTLGSQRGVSETSEVVHGKAMVGAGLESLVSPIGFGPKFGIDGEPASPFVVSVNEVSSSGPSLVGSDPIIVLGCPPTDCADLFDTPMTQFVQPVLQPALSKTLSRHWKRSAREGQVHILSTIKGKGKRKAVLDIPAATRGLKKSRISDTVSEMVNSAEPISQARHIDASIQLDDGFRWRFSGFYGDPSPGKRALSWTLLGRLRSVDSLPWVCGGDFNDILCMNEKLGGSDKSLSGMVRFRQAVDDCDLVDLGFAGPRLTWNNRRDGVSNIQERLDRFFTDNCWRDRFGYINVQHLGFNSSDHRPILLSFSRVSRPHRGQKWLFRFEPFWLKESDLGGVVRKSWIDSGPSNSVADFQRKLSQCAVGLLGWSNHRFKSLRRQIINKNREIEWLYKSCDQVGVIHYIRSLEKSVEGLLECEELYWKQRSRTNWLEAGDRNSKFFHAKATARKKKNLIERLVDGNGCVHTSEAGLAWVIQDYFSIMFQSSTPSDYDILQASAGIKSRLSDVTRGELGVAFTAEEVRLAVFDLGPTKAPGPDGFHALFFQKFWDVIGVDVSRVCLQVLNGTSSIRAFNNTNVVLIPQIPNPTSPKDFRPISLCSVVYKTVTKVLASRLKHHLPDLISPNQSAFVPGRQIFDNVLVAFEMLHSMARKKSGKRGLMALKLDMSKAYDRVEWSFLMAVMSKMNFPSSWIVLVMDCVSSASLSFLLNGSAVCTVLPSRGLRQGCPLSPYLFLLCAEALSCLISDSEKGGRGLGFHCCRGGPLVSHMFFADDSILFCRATSEGGLSIRKILEVYERGSGQQINFQKSKLTFSPNVSGSTVANIQSVLNIEDCNSQDSYLGLPMMVGRNKRQLFNVIKELVWKLFRGWKDSLFSFGGKEVLIKAVAQAVPVYSMSLFQLPVSLCNDLSSMASKFCWIPRPTTFKTITAAPATDIRVADLFDVIRRGWDVDKLSSTLLPVDKDIVLSIPISWGGGCDSLSWHYDTTGVYTVQSGYRLAFDQQLVASASSPSPSSFWWNTLWRLHLPPKVRIFVWRACLNALPSLVNLWKRRIVESPRCIRCAAQVESSCHALF
ncbi:hypothetical protein Dsin_010558 [Dipteronia sinensis]|uniref:Reverse transcriptase domain-containing protein n=1 Tax=Dipteronia sinensis TaxID=43782 RepID=A0AAE0AT12_9ROSI|nr:hypothetical protein Dsin_010558 [Dipteronia sinensis]